MSTAELKEVLIKRIKDTNDDFILNETLHLLDLEAVDIEPLKLSNAQKNAIEEGEADFIAGRIFTHEEVNKELDEWLKK